MMADARQRGFMSRVQQGHGCWVWMGARSQAGPHGYGVLTVESRKVYAHRRAYELFIGPISVGLNVLHHCDNPPCVRPDHLFVGTQGDNLRDAAAKRRLDTVGKGRWTHCAAGHPYSDENTKRYRGWRYCLTCRRETRRRRRRQRRAVAAPTVDRRCGEQHHGHKLTVANVRRIRALAATGWSQRRLARLMGVSQPAIGQAINGRTWKRV